MDGPLKVVLAVLLVVAPAAATPVPLPADAAEPGPETAAPAVASPRFAPVVNETETTSFLAFPEDTVETARFGTVRVDVAGSVSLDNARLHARYDRVELRESFTARESEAARRAVINRTIDRIDARVTNLTERQQRAVRAYNRGDLSTRGFLRELAIVDARARSLQATVTQINTLGRSVGEPVPPTRIARLKAMLIPLMGPIRQEVGEAMRGNGTDAATRVYVETSASGVVLAMLQERRVGTAYVREAYVGEAFDARFSDNPMDLETFESRIDELYPWIAEIDPNRNTILTSEPYYTRAGVYGIEYNHPHGTTRNDDLTIYYDAGTDRVFREIQYKNVETIPTERILDRTGDGLRIQVFATRSGGPLLVNVTEVSTGESVDATVVIDGEAVGSTGIDGQLWTIAPRDEFHLEATSRGRNVSAVTNS